MREPLTKIHSAVASACVLALIALSASCTTAPVTPEVAPPSPAPVTQSPPAQPPIKAAPTAPRAPSRALESGSSGSPAVSAPPTAGVAFRAAAWSELPGWRDDAVHEAWSALAASCGPLARREPWRETCGIVARTPNPDAENARRFFERYFKAWQITSAEGAEDGLITGYYEPVLRGSRKRTSRYRYPLYAAPDDLVIVDLGEIYPELKGTSVRGRLEGRRVVPYYDRAQIEAGPAALRGKELIWVDDPIDLFFLQIQGSGRAVLDGGETIRVAYADNNGHPYRSIGRVLIDRGELALEQASMQGIKQWARDNPDRLAALLNTNARYVFFRELPANGAGPPGSLGVPLTPRRSVAVDPRLVPLGAPVFLSTTWPNSTRPLNRLMLAQDTGSAIRGAVRADFFWGYGEAAAREAGRMKQRLRMWVLLPNGYPNPNAALAD
jgi:membrane-bound lytic murein transglycosylase A